MIRKIQWALLLCVASIVTAPAWQARTSASPQTPKSQPLVISGCLQDASGSTTGMTGADSAMAQARYFLEEVQYGASAAAFDEWMREHSQLTSTIAVTGASGSGGLRDGRPTELHLGTAREPKIDLSKYVGQNIEVTGTLGPIAATGAQAGTLSRATDRGAPAGAKASSSPVLTVTAVKALSSKCTG